MTPFFQLQRLDDLCEFPYTVIEPFHSVNWNDYLYSVTACCGFLESREIRVGVHLLTPAIEIEDTSLSLHYKIVFSSPQEFETKSGVELDCSLEVRDVKLNIDIR